MLVVCKSYSLRHKEKMEMATAATPTKAKTTAGWKKAAVHTVTLPSGFEADIRIPNLPQLVKTGYFPNDLVDQALKTNANSEAVTRDTIVENAAFYDKLVTVTLVEPKVTEEEVKDLPYEDIEMLVEFATRQRDLDATGQHIGGLHTSKTWQRFRGLNYSDPVVADV